MLYKCIKNALLREAYARSLDNIMGLWDTLDDLNPGSEKFDKLISRPWGVELEVNGRVAPDTLRQLDLTEKHKDKAYSLIREYQKKHPKSAQNLAKTVYSYNYNYNHNLAAQMAEELSTIPSAMLSACLGTPQGRAWLFYKMREADILPVSKLSNTCKLGKLVDTVLRGWLIVHDGSLGNTGYELVSPVFTVSPMNLSKVLKELRTFFRVPKDNPYYGGHINVTYNGVGLNTSIVSLLTLVALWENRVFEGGQGDFNSRGYRFSTYVHYYRSVLSSLNRTLLKEVLRNLDAEPAAQLKERLNSLSRQKYCAVSTRGIASDMRNRVNGRVEFRAWYSTLDPKRLWRNVLFSQTLIKEAENLSRIIASERRKFRKKQAEKGEKEEQNSFVNPGPGLTAVPIGFDTRDIEADIRAANMTLTITNTEG